MSRGGEGRLLSALVKYHNRFPKFVLTIVGEKRKCLTKIDIVFKLWHLASWINSPLLSQTVLPIFDCRERMIMANKKGASISCESNFLRQGSA